MRIPPFWAKGAHTGADGEGNQRTAHASGWSFDSLEEAKTNAVARARKAFEAWISGARPGAYDYLDSPLKEEIVESLGSGDDQIAIVTRNRYGALVLNSANVAFVDIDFPPLVTAGFLDAILCAFSAARREKRAQASQDDALGKVRSWAGGGKERSMRVYRTPAGLRLLLTDRLYDPKDSGTVDVLRELGTDPLYMKLTERQECFRARLTPKPWRCECSDPPSPFPWDDPNAESRFRNWQREYESKRKGYAACRLVEEIGSPSSDEQIAAIIQLHDEYACGSAGEKLA
jgi:hypothetical protein